MGALTEVARQLAPAKQAKLENLEERIEAGRSAFVSMGNALREIQADKELYESYGTFEAYCLARWGLERRRAYQIMAAAAVVERVKNFSHPPEIESHAAAIAKLPEEEQAEAWEEAVETAPEDGITAAHIAEVVRQRLREHGDEPKKPDLRAATMRLLALLNRSLTWWPEGQHEFLGKALAEWGAEVAETGRFPE